MRRCVVICHDELLLLVRKDNVTVCPLCVETPNHGIYLFEGGYGLTADDVKVGAVKLQYRRRVSVAQ